MYTQDTICAIATAPGNGAIAMIRLSGGEALQIAGDLFTPIKKQHSLTDAKANSLHYGTIRYEGKIIDEVVAGIFRGPHSYTGEDVVEISCHGSQFIQQKLLEVFTRSGARLAEPGEFTLRAFTNGKMDLSQAEAVADLIASTNEASHKVAMHQMRGGFKQEIEHLRDKLLHFISLIELELDFSEEDVEFADRKKLRRLLESIQKIITRLRDSFQLGNVIKNGVPVAIVGHTNVGKSTLLNQLLREEKAIVSDIAGTTRDVIEDVVTISGVQFRFIDTAGIRDTQDAIETLGIERTFERIDKASVVLQLVDATEPTADVAGAIDKVKQRMAGTEKKLLVLINKTDSVDSPAHLHDLRQVLANKLDSNDVPLEISAKLGTNVDKLIDELVSTINLQRLNSNDVIVTNARHHEALSHAADALQRAYEGLDIGIPGDLMAQDIREVLHYLGEITGTISTDEVLGNIFKNFCIGK